MIVPDISLEEILWQRGFVNVAGVDEAGKGPLAGPVTAGAVMIHSKSQMVEGVRDSKLMSERQRESVFDEICRVSSGFGVGIVEAREIDLIGIDMAVQKAMLMALSSLEDRFGQGLTYVIVDGSKTKILPKYESQRIKKGGLYHYSISAGSILAKVTRDRIMHGLASKYPIYNFEKHVGYGTKMHLETIKKYGPCEIHRKTFEPIKSLGLK
ncbi:MAG TPA: ribonuclease HII [Patescibacteria group bacterium]